MLCLYIYAFTLWWAQTAIHINNKECFVISVNTAKITTAGLMCEELQFLPYPGAKKHLG